MIKQIAFGLGSGLVVGSMAGTLPTFQFWCFAIGMTLLNYANFKNPVTESHLKN